MSVRFLKTLAAVAGLLCVNVFSAPLSGQGQDVRHTVQIAPDVYTFTGGGSNSSFVVTPEGVLVFDADIRNDDLAVHSQGDGQEDRLPAVVACVWRSLDRGLALPRRPAALHRDPEPDQLVSGGAEGIQAATSRRRGRQQGARSSFRPPSGFDDILSIHFGGLTFIARAEGYGHTNGDLTVYIPQRRTMFMGDLLNNEIHPGQAEAAGVFFAQVQSWIDILNKVVARNLPVDTYVPGHGPPHVGRGAADLEEQRDYFIAMRSEVAKMISAGKTLEQIQKEFKVPQRFANYSSPNRLTPFLRLYYNQLIEAGTAN